MIQEIIAFVVLAVAVGYLVNKFFLKKKSKKGCDTDCGCS